MKDKDTAVIYDLDSTVCDTRGRWHLSPRASGAAPDSSWEKYSLACRNDLPIVGTIASMQLHWPHHQVHLCSGRSGVAREDTGAWLRQHAPDCWDYLELRAEGDYSKNADFKVRYIEVLQASGLQVVLFYEDWGEAAAAIYERTGVPVLGVTAFYPEDEVATQQASVDGIGGGL